MTQDSHSEIFSTLRESGRLELKDKAIRANIENEKMSNLFLVRLVAKRKTFKCIDFKYTIFDGCYFRDCIFDSCDFTGCRFLSSNLNGAKFIGCKFDYATFERTMVDDRILDSSCPGPENLRMRFARALRMNYQQMGDALAANKAVHIELEAEETHLHKAWKSKESYYRKKYQGLTRLKMFAQWFEFKVLDLVWGNGESVYKLVRFVFVLLILIAVADIDIFGDSMPRSALEAAQRASQIFLGILMPKEWNANLLTAIVFMRLVTFGFFMSIIIKRFNRR